MVEAAALKVKELLKDFVNFSANFLTLDFLEAVSDERLKRMEEFASRFTGIFNRFKTEKDFKNFENVYESLQINEKRLILEIIGHTKITQFAPFLLQIAKSNSFYSIDAIISLGQIGGAESVSELEGLLENSGDGVHSKVLKSVIHSLKKGAIGSVV